MKFGFTWEAKRAISHQKENHLGRCDLDSAMQPQSSSQPSAQTIAICGIAPSLQSPKG